MPGLTSGEVSGTSTSQSAAALSRRWESEGCLSRLSDWSHSTDGTAQSKRLPRMSSRPSFTQSLFTVSTSSSRRSLAQVNESQQSDSHVAQTASSEIQRNLVSSQSVPAMLNIWRPPQSNTSADSGSSSVDSWTDNTASLSTIHGPSSLDGALNPLDSANSKSGKNDPTHLFGLNKFSLSGNLPYFESNTEDINSATVHPSRAGAGCMPNCWRRLIDFLRQKLNCFRKNSPKIEPETQQLFDRLAGLGFKTKALKKLLVDFGPKALLVLDQAWDKLGEINTAEYANNIYLGMVGGVDVNSYNFLTLHDNKLEAVSINARRHVLKSLAPYVLQELSQIDANLQQHDIHDAQVIEHVAPDLIAKLSAIFVDLMENNREEMLYHFPAYLFERPLNKYPTWLINLYLKYLILSNRRSMQNNWQDIGNSLQFRAENNNKVVPWEKIRVHVAYKPQQGIDISLGRRPQDLLG